MNILLLSMPDSFEHMAPVAVRIPNGALASIAGNVDRHHHASIADLVLVQGQVRTTVERLVRELRPDVVETSRGCTYDCSFCSIIEMRGRNFHPYPIERVLADISDARHHGARAIFLVDDNITLDVRRFEELCRVIIDSGYQDTDFFVQ